MWTWRHANHLSVCLKPWLCNPDVLRRRTWGGQPIWWWSSKPGLMACRPCTHTPYPPQRKFRNLSSLGFLGEETPLLTEIAKITGEKIPKVPCPLFRITVYKTKFGWNHRVLVRWHYNSLLSYAARLECINISRRGSYACRYYSEVILERFCYLHTTGKRRSHPILMFKESTSLTTCVRNWRRVLADGTGCLGVCDWINISSMWEFMCKGYCFVVQQN